MGERSIGVIFYVALLGALIDQIYFVFLMLLVVVVFFFVTRRLPGYKRRIGGQCLPFEDFAIHKANKYFKQNGRLFLPGVVSNVEPRLI